MPPLYSNNTTYNSTAPGSNKSGRIGFSALRSLAQQNVQKAITNNNSSKQKNLLPSDLQSLTNINNPITNTDQSTQFPVNEALAEPVNTKPELLSQYRKDTGEALPTQTNQSWYTPETETTKIANMPNFLGGGQYLTDLKSGNVANEREFVPEENQAILGGRDSRLYQIDHIIPLWAGGGDTLANKEILTIDEHHKKSKAQAVPFTLMANGIIPPQEAKNLAINWQDKDITGIPEEATSGGFIDMQLAQRKYEEWKREKPVTFKDVLRAVPETLKNITKPLAAKTGEDPSEQFMKSLAGGFVSEASFGILPYQSESTDISSKAGGFLGKVAGNVVAFASLDGLIGKAWQAATGLKFLKPFANSAEVAGDLLGGAQATREGISVAGKVAGEIGNKIPVAVSGVNVDALLNSGAKSGLNNLTKRIKIASVLKNAGLMNAYGQIRITAPAMVGLEKMPDMGQRMNQALVDTAYGGLLGQAGHTLPGYASVGAGALAIGLMSGDNAQNAVLDAATMMALHGLGHSASNANKKLPTLEEAMNRVADQTATDHVFKRIGEKINKLNPDSAINLRVKLNDSRSQLISKANLDLDEIAKLRLQDEVAIRQLEKGGMSQPVRRDADIQDMSSVGDKLRTKEQLQDITIPDEITQIAKTAEDHLFTNSPLPATEGGKVSGASQPVGDFPLSGMAKQIEGGLPKKRVDYFFNALQNKNAAPNLLLIERSELAPFFEELNNSKRLYDSKKIKSNDDTLFQHPENSVQVFGVVKVTDAKTDLLPGVLRIKGSSGPLDIVPLGWSARKSRIATVEEGGRNHSFNQNAIDRGIVDDLGEGWLLNHNNNKDTLAEAMRANNVKILTASIDPRSTPRAKISEEPFILTNIKPENWSNSVELNKQRIGQSLGDNVDTLVNKAVKTNDPQAITSVIQHIQERNPDLGAAKIMNNVALNSKDPDTAFAADVLKTFEDGINSGSSNKLKDDVNKKYGPILDDNTALHLLANKNNFTVENAFDILHDGIVDGKANAGTAIMYRNNLIPLFEKINTQNINLDGIPMNTFFPKMPVVANKGMILSEEGVNVESPTPATSIEKPITEKSYEKFNTFSPQLTPNQNIYPKSTQEIYLDKKGNVIPAPEGAPLSKPIKEELPLLSVGKKQQELDLVKKEGTELIDNFEIHGHESDADILNRINGQINRLVDTYQWTGAEKQQVKDLLSAYATNKIKEQNAPTGEFVNNFDDVAIAPTQGLKNELPEDINKTSFSSPYPDIYSSSGRTNELGQGIANRLNVEQLTRRASNTNKNSFANDLQASANTALSEGKESTSLLWKNILDEFDRLGKSSDWRNKNIDTAKFNQNIEKLTSDLVTTGKRAGQLKTVNPEIANYEMDINVGRIDNLPEPLKKKYEELQKDGYGHVYSSSSMNTHAYKGRTSGESSYNMFKYIKEYVENKDDKSVVKEIYGDNQDEAKKALEAIKTWRLGDSLTLDRLASLEEQMYGDKKPGIAKALENKKIDLNQGVSPEMIESGLSPISLEDFKESPEFNNPLSHAIMSLSKYNIDDLTPAEIKKLSKSVSFTLWPAVRGALKSEELPAKKSIKKNDGKGGPGDNPFPNQDEPGLTNKPVLNQSGNAIPSNNKGISDIQAGSGGNTVTQKLFQGASDFSNKVNLKKYLNLTPTIDKSQTIFGKLINQGQSRPTAPLARPLAQPQKEPNTKQLGHIISMVESSGGQNVTNKNSDQGKYGYVVGFTKDTYNDIKKKASQGDARYQSLLKNLNFDTPEKAKQSAIHYFNFRNTLFDEQGKAIGQKYSNLEDAYVNGYNASSGPDSFLARKNWKNVVNQITKNTN